MKKNFKAWLIAFLLVIICVSQADARCESPDNMNYVSGTAHRLAIKTYSPSSGFSKTHVAAIWNIP